MISWQRVYRIDLQLRPVLFIVVDAGYVDHNYEGMNSGTNEVGGRFMVMRIFLAQATATAYLPHTRHETSKLI